MATATNGTNTYRRMQQMASTNSSVAKRLDLADFRTVEELYHVAEDPDCLVNLVADPKHQSALEKLRSRLHQQLVSTHDPIAGVLKERDPAAMERFVAASQVEADARRAAKRKKNPRAGANQALKGAIKLQRRNVRIDNPQHASITVVHGLADKLGKQKLHVTLKAVDQKRIARRVVEIEGTGKVVIDFDLPSNDAAIGAVAAFIGESYQTSLEHVQVQVK